MTMTDPIADMLTRIRNANTAMHDEVSMPSSKQKMALAELLRHEGYIASFSELENVDPSLEECLHMRDDVARGAIGAETAQGVLCERFGGGFLVSGS